MLGVYGERVLHYGHVTSLLIHTVYYIGDYRYCV